MIHMKQKSTGSGSDFWGQNCTEAPQLSQLVHGEVALLLCFCLVVCKLEYCIAPGIVTKLRLNKHKCS